MKPVSRQPKKCAAKLWAVAAMIAFAYSGTVRAYVYRCIVDGHMVYTDVACAPNSAPADLPDITPVQAVPHADFAQQYDDEARRQAIIVRKARAEQIAAFEKKTAAETAIRKAVIEGRVVPGMTTAQVESVLNLPSRIEDQGGPHERWFYQNGRDRRTVTFKDGVVVSDRNGAYGAQR